MLKKSYKYIVAFFVLYLLWAVGLPLLFKCNTENIENLIEKNSGYKVVMKNPKLRTGTVLRIKIKADEFDIINHDNSKVLSVNNPKVAVRLLPLIIGKSHIRTFECKNINADFTIKNNQLYLGDYIINIPEKKINSNIDRIKIESFNISFLDKSSNEPIILTGKDFYYKETMQNIYARNNSNILINKSLSDINLDIKVPKKHYLKKSKVNLDINNFELKPLTNILKTFVKDEIISLDGNINIKSDDTNLDGQIARFKLIMKDDAKSIIFPEKLTIDSDFILKSNTLNLRKCVIDGDDVKVGINGLIKNFTSSRPDFDIRCDMGKSDVRKIALLLPPLVVPQFNIYRLKMYPFYGFAEANLRIKGKFPEPNIDGNVHISDAYMIKPIPNADKAIINIKCNSKKMNIDVIVPAGENQTVYVTGDIDDYGDNKADLKIRSTKTVDLALAEFVLNPLHQILRFPIGPVPIMDVTGVGNINIRVVGTKKDPHIWGDFNFANTSASFDDLYYLTLKDAEGNLHFQDRDAHFINRKGTVNNQPFTVDGKCNLYGNIDFNVIGNNQPLDKLIYVLKDSPMLEPLKGIIPDIQDAKGNVDLSINLTGKLPDIYKIHLNENLFAKGKITLKNNGLILNRIPIKKVQGIIGFNNLDIDLDLLSSFDDSSIINIKGSVKDGIANILANSSRFNIKEFTKDIFKELDDCFISFNANYKGNIQNIDISKLQFNGKVLKNNNPIRNIKIMTGNMELKNSRLKLSNIYGFVKQNPFNINLLINNIDTDIRKTRINGNFNAKNFDLKTINSFKKLDIFPYQIQNILEKFEFLNGNSDIKLDIKNNRINGGFSLENINAVYNMQKTPQAKSIPIPLKLINGEIIVKNNRLFVNKMNCLADDMPVLIYGNIENIFRTPKINMHINSKLSQKTFDKYWNIDTIYPIKVKGDIILGTLFTGTLEKLNTKLDLKLESNSSIYYMGATVGDTENPITVNTNFDILKNNILRLNYFQYNKLISSQNNKQNILPLLTVTGGITYYDNQFYTFDNLIVKTHSPTDARIFNILFRKPTIKHGQFVSDLKINGKSTSPRILGDLVINGIDMPFLSTTVKDLSLSFDERNVIVQSKGEILSNNIIVNAKVKNKFTSTYNVEKADISLKHLDINTLMSEVKQLELKTFNDNQNNFSQTNNNMLNSIIFDDLTIHADSLAIKNMNAKNLNAKCSLNDKMMFSVNNFSFDIADGKIEGDAQYNLLNNVIKLGITADNVSANDLLIALADVPNQIYGKLTGKINLTSNVTTEKTSKETLSGTALFTVKDGKMPKLGSLEYLLKAGNVIKSGITGMTINNIIDLFTPLKNGEFSSIDGKISINNGVANNIEIHSKSDDLNLFIKGKYNLVTEIADMMVLGQISRKISTVLGTIGNVSLNSLFNKIPGIDLSENKQLINELNKIPGIEISNKAYRKFVVEIYGDINTDNNVKSFKWVNKD